MIKEVLERETLEASIHFDEEIDVEEEDVKQVDNQFIF